MSIADRIKAARLARRWSLEDLAKASGLSKTYLWELETGRADNPGVQTLVALSDSLGLLVEEIVRGKLLPGDKDPVAEVARLRHRLAAVEAELRRVLALAAAPLE